MRIKTNRECIVFQKELSSCYENRVVRRQVHFVALAVVTDFAYLNSQVKLRLTKLQKKYQQTLATYSS